jgi:hypothetical protein
MLHSYLTKISRNTAINSGETLYRYNDDFHSMLSSNRILAAFGKSKREEFSMAGEMLRMEQRAVVTLVILSVLAGLASLVPIYFQFVLVKAVMGNTGQYYSLAVVVTVMFVRFIILNVKHFPNAVCIVSLQQYRPKYQDLLAEHLHVCSLCLKGILTGCEVYGCRSHRRGLLLPTLSDHLPDYHCWGCGVCLSAGRSVWLHCPGDICGSVCCDSGMREDSFLDLEGK